MEHAVTRKSALFDSNEHLRWAKSWSLAFCSFATYSLRLGRGQLPQEKYLRLALDIREEGAQNTSNKLPCS